MRCRSLMLLVPALFAPACQGSGEQVLLAPPGARQDANAEATVVSQASVPVDHALYHPCTDERVAFTGSLRLELRARRLEADVYDVRYTAQAPQVRGEGSDSGGKYLLVGAATGGERLSHRERVVTIADFEALAHKEPAAPVGRARARPRHLPVQALVSFGLGPDAGVQAPHVEGLLTEQKCGD